MKIKNFFSTFFTLHSNFFSIDHGLIASVPEKVSYDIKTAHSALGGYTLVFLNTPSLIPDAYFLYRIILATSATHISHYAFGAYHFLLFHVNSFALFFFYELACCASPIRQSGNLGHHHAGFSSYYLYGKM